jgi:hypothetical protein
MGGSEKILILIDDQHQEQDDDEPESQLEFFHGLLQLFIIG